MEEKILLLALMGVTVAVNAVFAVPQLNYGNRPSYIDCVTSAECGKSECCSMNFGRFSIPTCRPRPELGDSCRPGSLPYSVNVTYPDDITVHLKDIYYVLCPCQGSLTCSSDGNCIDLSEDPRFNYMND
uniref:Putative prokineticin-like cytokine n=1 Tax=Panstrongylus lignarius TaxID=156445 RepID=A0A224XP57_9HEMI